MRFTDVVERAFTQCCHDLGGEEVKGGALCGVSVVENLPCLPRGYAPARW
jgi:hypothetical protein